MTELRIWTTRQKIRVAAQPKRVFELVANIDNWPVIFDSVAAVERLGFDGARELFRIVENSGNSWTTVRDTNLRQLQVRYRRTEPPVPLVSMGGLWRVVPEALSTVVGLDHHYRVADDSPETAAVAGQQITAIGAAMLSSLRRFAEADGVADRIAS